jgi:hypothetical protein
MRNAQAWSKEELKDNGMCRFLATSKNLEGEALLEDAKKNLDSFDAIVFFDNFASDVIDLFKRFDIDLQENDIIKINTTEKEPVSSELMQKIEKMHELDMQLYEYAKSHYRKKTSPYPYPKTTFEKLSKKSSHIDYTFDQPLRGSGWTYRDEDKNQRFPIYRWVMDQPAEIYFSLEEGVDYLLSFTACCLTSEVTPHVLVNERPIELKQVNQEKYALYEGIISKDHITNEPTEITFYSDKAFQYRDIYPNRYNRNHPPLSFALNRIQLSPQNSDKTR